MVQILAISITESCIGHPSKKALYLFEQTPNKILEDWGWAIALLQFTTCHISRSKVAQFKAYPTDWVFIRKILDFLVKKTREKVTVQISNYPTLSCGITVYIWADFLG